ncbi:MAG: DEAD/DEAH box helicase [Paenibacillus sp.]|nr:DEAD/DEAH box helicase [Paenibacillus sp.]
MLLSNHFFFFRAAQKQLDTLKLKLNESLDKEKLTTKITQQATKLRNAVQDEKDILARLQDRKDERLKSTLPADKKNTRQENETQREFLIRTGKVTPFSNLPETKLYDTTITSSSAAFNTVFPGSGHSTMSHQNLHTPHHQVTNKRKISSSDEEDDTYIDEEDDYTEETILLDDDDELFERKKHSLKKLDEIYNDDGSESNYQKRLTDWIQQRQIMRNQVTHEADEIFKSHPNFDDIEFDNGLKVPGELWDCLFDYQKTCVQWLWELHCQKVGGILGDEMGLGKTIQVIAFLSSLYYSKILGPGQPSIIVCPATVMKQWVQEFHKWWPPLRVAILHSSGTGVKTCIETDDITMDDQEAFSDDEEEEYEPDRRGKQTKKGKGKTSFKSILTTKAGRNAAALVSDYVKKGGILITTYSGVQTYREILLKHRWGYVVLDEGHKIRNPDSSTTLAIKRFKVNTPYKYR